ncbi:MAG TPA: class I SAM-dependent methyltransferase [Pyrinomonadaceae bacterium]|jgi:SAM-dependent methyltransferase
MTSVLPDNYGFSAERLERLAEIERWHFWFVGRRALIDKLLAVHLKMPGATVLDLGCGTGLMLESLTLRGNLAIGLDLRPEGLAATRRDLPAARLLRADATSLPLADASCDAILLLDILEHLDDRALLKEVKRTLRPGGLLVLTVPALPWLWSYRDLAAGHLRRYRRGELCALLEESGLRIQEMRYYQCLLFPLVALTRLGGRRGPAARDMEERPISFLNSLLTWVNRLEVKLGQLIRWPIGSSLVAVCRKR